jgi:CBS domain-containing protein
MQVRDVMTRGVICVEPDTILQEAADQMRRLDVGMLPVCSNDRLVGSLTDRDITVRSTAEGYDPWTIHVADVMTPEVIYCHEDQDVDEAAGLMKEKQVRRLPVLNRAKRMVGIVSLGDLAVQTGDEEMAGEALEAVSEQARPHRP